jgi:hypothetical protein
MTKPPVLVLVFHYFTDISITNKYPILGWNQGLWVQILHFMWYPTGIIRKKGSRRLSSFQNTSPNDEVMDRLYIACPPITPNKTKLGAASLYYLSTHHQSAAYDQTFIYIFIICASFWMIENVMGVLPQALETLLWSAKTKE